MIVVGSHTVEFRRPKFGGFRERFRRIFIDLKFLKLLQLLQLPKLPKLTESQFNFHNNLPLLGKEEKERGHLPF